MNESQIGRMWDESELAEQENRLARVAPAQLADLIRIEAAARAMVNALNENRPSMPVPVAMAFVELDQVLS